MKLSQCNSNAYSIHTQEVHRFGFNIHAHTHLETIKAWRYQAGGYVATQSEDPKLHMC